MVVEISRHGARSPKHQQFGDDWSMESGSLTKVGMIQHYLIGRQLRKLYIEQTPLLSSEFNSSEIFILCDSSSRTIMSAQSQMFGLFFNSTKVIKKEFNPQYDLPPIIKDDKEGQQFLEELIPFQPVFQPVPEYAYPDEMLDEILSPKLSCTKIIELQQENEQSEVYSNFVQILHKNNIFERFREAFDLPSTDYLDTVVLSMYQANIICDMYERRPLPEKFTADQDLQDWLQYLYDFHNLYQQFGSDLNIKLQATQFFKDIVNSIKLPVEKRKKFLLYSIRGQVSLINLAMSVFQVPDDFENWKQNRKFQTTAAFASTLFLEIYTDDVTDQEFVKYIYNGDVIKNWGDCMEVYCPIETFISSFQKWILKDSEYNFYCTPAIQSSPKIQAHKPQKTKKLTDFSTRIVQKLLERNKVKRHYLK